MSLDLIWIPTWANPGDVPSRAKSLGDWRRSLPPLLNVDDTRVVCSISCKEMYARLFSPSLAWGGDNAAYRMLTGDDLRVKLDPVVDLTLENDDAGEASAVGVSRCVFLLDELLPRVRFSQTLIELSNLVGPPGLPDVPVIMA